MARGKLECQCQLFWERNDRRAERTLEDFNVMTEKSKPALLNDGGRQKSVGGPSFT